MPPDSPSREQIPRDRSTGWASTGSIKLATPQRNYGAGGSCRSLNGLCGLAAPLELDAGALWDRVVEAENAARTKRIVLLGHVPEASASILADRISGELHTIDLFSDLAPPRDGRNQRLAADFAFPAELDLAYEALRSLPGPVLLVALNLLEHLADPRPALTFMRRLLLHEAGNLLLLASRDRAMTEAPAEAAMAGMRLWSRAELASLLSMSGFDLGDEVPTHVRIAMNGGIRSHALLLARCTLDGYNDFLRAQGLPYAYDPRSAIHLVLTDEHARILPVSGGIGSYVEDLEVLSGNVFVAFNRGLAGRPQDFLQGYRCLHPGLFWDAIAISPLAEQDFPELSLPLIQQILFYYPNVQSIEYQECNGHGARLAAAKRAGMLPQRVLLIARCHGSQVYLEVGFQQWVATASLGSRLMIQEKLAVELADIVSMPSRYLRDLYLEYGFDIDPLRLRMEPYAYAIRMALSDSPYRPIDTLVFFGRRQLHKGFAEFLDVLELMDFAQGTIRKVIIFGARAAPTAHDDVARIARLRQVVEIEECTTPRGELHARLLALAPSALVLMPYRADNAPLSIYEVLSAGCQFLAADRGGIPELIPRSFHREVLFSIEPPAMVARIHEACQLDGAHRRALVASLQAATTAMLDANRTANLATIAACYRDGPPAAPGGVTLAAELFTVAVPVFNPTPQQMRDLCDALNAQTLRPREVIFVDDGSEPTCRRQTEAVIAEHLRIAYRVIEHDVGRGFAAACNSALEATRTRYFLLLDADGIPLPDHFRRLVYAMEYDPTIWVATCFTQSFSDRVDWRDLSAVLAENGHQDGCYRPLGAGIVDSLIDNNLGDAHGCYRVEPIRRIGGWDTLGKAKRDDRAMYVSILSRHGRILVTPSADYLHRTRIETVQRTCPTFPAERLQARALDPLPRFERYRMIALARELAELRARIPTDTLPLRYRAVDRLVMLLNRAPRAKRVLIWTFLAAYRAARFAKRRISTGRHRRT